MVALDSMDVNYLVSRLPKDLFYQLTHAKKDYVVAGGYIRALIAHEKVSDIDIFAKSKEDADFLANKLQPDKNKIYATENAYTFTLQGKTTQIIHRWTFNSPLEIMLHFDFTVAQACFWYNRKTKLWDSLSSPSFYKDLAAKRLVYTFPEDAEPGGSLLRILKFKGKGYNPLPQSLAEVVARLAGVDFDTVFNKLKEVDPAADPNAPANKYSSQKELTEASAKPTIAISTSISFDDEGYPIIT